MSVPSGRRKTSRNEFDAIYFQIHDDAVDMIEHNFRAKPEIAEKHKAYIATASKELMNLVWDLIHYVKIANTFYPVTREELIERRICQDKAIGACLNILTVYELVMRMLKVKEDYGVVEMKHIMHEINAIKAWRTSDNKRYKNLQ